jgi:hypothetical protein
MFVNVCAFVVDWMSLQVDQMLQDHAWILDEKQYFGHANTAYDFKVNDPKEAGRRIQKLQETKEKLARNVNMRAMNMLGKAEEQVSVCRCFFVSCSEITLKIDMSGVGVIVVI